MTTPGIRLYAAIAGGVFLLGTLTGLLLAGAFRSEDGLRRQVQEYRTRADSAIVASQETLRATDAMRKASEAAQREASTAIAQRVAAELQANVAHGTVRRLRQELTVAQTPRDSIRVLLARDTALVVENTSLRDALNSQIAASGRLQASLDLERERGDSLHREVNKLLNLAASAPKAGGFRLRVPTGVSVIAGGVVGYLIGKRI